MTSTVRRRRRTRPPPLRLRRAVCRRTRSARRPLQIRNLHPVCRSTVASSRSCLPGRTDARPARGDGLEPVVGRGPSSDTLRVARRAGQRPSRSLPRRRRFFSQIFTADPSRHERRSCPPARSSRVRSIPAGLRVLIATVVPGPVPVSGPIHAPDSGRRFQKAPIDCQSAFRQSLVAPAGVSARREAVGAYADDGRRRAREPASAGLRARRPRPRKEIVSVGVGSSRAESCGGGHRLLPAITPAVPPYAGPTTGRALNVPTKSPLYTAPFQPCAAGSSPETSRVSNRREEKAEHVPEPPRRSSIGGARARPSCSSGTFMTFDRPEPGAPVTPETSPAAWRSTRWHSETTGDRSTRTESRRAVDEIERGGREWQRLAVCDGEPCPKACLRDVLPVSSMAWSLTSTPTGVRPTPCKPDHLNSAPQPTSNTDARATPKKSPAGAGGTVSRSGTRPVREEFPAAGGMRTDREVVNVRVSSTRGRVPPGLPSSAEYYR
jgi:hypothetical protein